MEINLLNEIKKNICMDELVKLSEKLISIESHQNAINYEEEIGFFINNFLLGYGINSELQMVDKHRYNVIAKIKGKNENNSLLLTGHMDTVGDYGYNELFTPKIKDGKLYGRGAADMKGPIAAMLMSIIAIKKLNIVPNWNIILALVVDEEFKSIGTEKLIKSGIKANAAILGEPTKLSIAPGNRGLEWVDIVVTGKGTHGGTANKGINAISMASKLIEKINEELVPKINNKFHPILGSSTMNIGVIKGGYQPSTVPEECLIKIDRRWIFGESVENIYSEYEGIIKEINNEDINFKAELFRDSFNMNEMEHGPVCLEKDHYLIKDLLKFTEQVTGKTPQIEAFPGWTDASLLSNYGKIPTVIFGPGDIACAHSKGEYIDLNELYNAAIIYAYTAINCNGDDM